MTDALRRAVDLLLYRTEPLGRVGRIGLGLILAAVLFMLMALVPAWLSLGELRAKNQTLMAERGSTSETGNAASAAQSSGGPEKALGALFDIAQETGLMIDQASYQSLSRAAVSQSGLQLSLPVSAGFSEIRGFLQLLLQSPLGFELQDFRLSRPSIDDSEIQGSLRIALHASTGGGSDAVKSPLSASPQADLFASEATRGAGVSGAQKVQAGPPEFPFEYVGQWQEGGAKVFFFEVFNAGVVQVRLSEVLLRDWRLEAVADSSITFTYMPLKMAATMRISQ